jgi:hypothetical protein
MIGYQHLKATTMSTPRYDRLARRLAGIEQRRMPRRPEGALYFLIWGTSDQDCAERLISAKERKDLVAGDTVVCIVWLRDEGLPAPRWITAKDRFEQQEDDVIHQHCERILRNAGRLTDDGDLTNDCDLSVCRLTDTELIGAAWGRRV